MPRPKLITSVLGDADAERVRRSHHHAIEDLQARIEVLERVAAMSQWQHVSTSTLTATASSMPVKGITREMANDDEWRIIYEAIVTTGSSKYLLMTPSGDGIVAGGLDSRTTQGQTQYAYANGWSTWFLGTTTSIAHCDFRIRPRTGKLRTYRSLGTAMQPTTAGFNCLGAGGLDNSVTPITGMTLSTTANSLNIGTTIHFFRRPYIAP